MSGVPLRIVNFLEDLTPSEIKHLRTVEVIFSGGCSSVPYIPRLQSLLPHATIREVYNASEAYIASQSHPQKPHMSLMTNHGVYFEFVPMDEFGSKHPTILSLAEVELDTNYAILITTLGGLARYVIGDTVRFVDLDEPSIVVTGRTKEYLDTFNDHTTVEHLQGAIMETSEQTGLSIIEYTVAPNRDQDPDRYEWIIETPTKVSAESQKNFASELDENLSKANPHLRAKRDGGVVHPLVVHRVSKGFFTSWLKDQGKEGNQHKVPRCRPDRTVMESMLS